MLKLCMLDIETAHESAINEQQAKICACPFVENTNAYSTMTSSVISAITNSNSSRFSDGGSSNNNSSSSRSTSSSSATNSPVISQIWIPNKKQNVWVKHFQQCLVGDVIALLSITLAASSGSEVNERGMKQSFCAPQLFY